MYNRRKVIIPNGCERMDEIKKNFQMITEKKEEPRFGVPRTDVERKTERVYLCK